MSHSRKRILAPVIFAALLMTKVSGTEDDVTYRSPDEKLGIRNWDDGRVELVALPSRKTLLKLDLYTEIAVLWAPDSHRFAAHEDAFEDGVQLYQTKIFERDGASFRNMQLPELSLPSAEWPDKKGRLAVHGREFILPARWVDSNTLVLKRECKCVIFGQNGDEKDEKEWSLSHEITIGFDSEHRASIQGIRKLD